MKKVRKVILIAVLAIVLLIAAGILYITRGLNAVGSEELLGVNPSALQDGTYTGRYDTGRWANEVSVKIEDGRIVSIDIVEDVTFVKEETADALFEKVIDAQRTQVDAISGATVPSKAYLKAIEDALNG